jgi:hypothetical protein
MNDDILKILADIKNILLGIALMIAGLGAMFLGTTIDISFFSGLGVIVQIWGFVKAVKAWLAHEVVEVPDKKPSRPTESFIPESKSSSDRPISSKED